MIIAQQVDLTNCDKEPIHVPGYIQPHGLLFALQESDLTVLQISNNTFDFFSIHPHKLLGKNLDKLLKEDQINHLKKSLAYEKIEEINPLNITTNINGAEITFEGMIHLVRWCFNS